MAGPASLPPGKKFSAKFQLGFLCPSIHMCVCSIIVSHCVLLQCVHAGVSRSSETELEPLFDDTDWSPPGLSVNSNSAS